MSSFGFMGYFNDEASTSNTSRFGEVTEEDLQHNIDSRIPETTKNKTKWCLNLFTLWLTEWRIRLNGPPKVLKELTEMSNYELDYCLKYFVMEVRKTDGTKYPPRTLKEIIAGVQHHFNYVLKREMSIFTGQAFSATRESLDAEMKTSAKEGNVKLKRRANAISIDNERELWNNGTFGDSNPRQLIDTLIYHLGIHLALRAIDEHRDLEFGPGSQITLKTDENGQEYLLYVERTSKNKKIGIKKSNMEPKTTRIYSNEQDTKKCVVRLYKVYLSRRPEHHHEAGCSAFYLTPLVNPSGNRWYKAVPMGKNTIASTIKRITSSLPNANDLFYSNTSMRRTAKTRLVESGIPKELCAKKTGHLSNADETYIDTCQQEKVMTNALYGQSSSNKTSTVNIKSTSSQECTMDQVFKMNTFNNCQVTINFNS